MRKVLIVLPLICLLSFPQFCAAEAKNGRNGAMLAADGSVERYGSTLYSAEAASTSIRIQHPGENAQLGNLNTTFVCGYALPGGTLTVNGLNVPIHPEGGFLTMVRLSSGACAINAELLSGTTVYTLTRTVNVDGPSMLTPADPVTIDSVGPGADCTVMTGDEITVTAKGSPGMQASFKVKGARLKFPMVEKWRGFYNGVYVVGAEDELEDSKVTVTLVDKENHEKEHRESDGAISRVSEIPVAAEINAENAVLRVGPAISRTNSAAINMHLPVGTVLRVTGNIGDETRIRLTATKDGWIKTSMLKILAPGTPPARGIAKNITIEGGIDSSVVRIPLGRKMPFEVLQDIDCKYTDIIIYGAYSNTDFMTYVSTGVIEQVKWYQDDSETLRIRAITPSGKCWGYDARYEGETLVLEVRNPPLPPAGSKLPLAGLTIAVDAGHSPETGSIGCTGLVERDVNIAIAKILKNKLTELGAKVVMTREDSEGVDLYARAKIAWRARADLFISVHNNALAYGGNPFEKNGYEIYYYNPASLALAKEIHSAYGETLGINAKPEYKLKDGGLKYGNFVITRNYQMPSVLIESAYMIVPREEAYLKTEKFQTACAEAMALGINRYMKGLRPAAKKPEIKKAAAGSRPPARGKNTKKRP